jgi:leucyl-tRNA synthetase
MSAGRHELVPARYLGMIKGIRGVSGVRGFLDRAWRMIVDDRAEATELAAAVADVEPNAEQNRMVHKTIQAVTRDVEQMSFNTAIARMMEFVNFFLRAEVRPKSALERFTLLLAPFAPHMAEELWQVLGHAGSLAYEPWPSMMRRRLKEDTIEVPVQINGKLRVVEPPPTQATEEARGRGTKSWKCSPARRSKSGRRPAAWSTSSFGDRSVDNLSV